MSNETRANFNEYLSRLWADFDVSTLISPNNNGEKEKGITVKSEYEFKKENLVGFAKANSLSTNEILLASLTLTLNKFNFSNETLIFNQNNVPFGAKFEDRQISIKEFLEDFHKNYNETFDFTEYANGEDFILKPEFYYSFNENPQSNLTYSNFLSIFENDETVSLSLYYNNELYTKDYIDLFLSSLEEITNQLINADIDAISICDIALVSERDDIAFSEVEMPLLHKRFEKHAMENPDRQA